MIEADIFEESKFLFRGQENESWKVETSAYRRLKRDAIQKEISKEDELYYNLGLIEQFKHADLHSGNSSKIMEMDLGILAQLQHNGAATSLIDFSDNPLVALYFACKENAGTTNNGKVFILSTGDETKFEEISSIKQIQNSKIRVPEQIEFFKGKNILNKEKSVYWKPAHLNNRITAQQSYFLIGEIMDSDMKKIIIKGDLKPSILEELSLVYGINEITLFPDLVGFAQANSTESPSGKEEIRLRKRMIIRHHDEIIKEINKEQKDTKANKIAKTTKLAEAYNNRAVAKYKLNDYEGAIKDWIYIININPNYTNALYNLGVTKSESKDYEEAIDYYNKTIKIDPNYADAYNNRGIVKRQLKNYRGAIYDYNKAIKLEPSNATAYYNCGNAKLELKNYKGAIDNYNKAIMIEPNTSIAYYNRATAKLKLKNYEGAMNDYNKVININPKNATAYHNRGIAKHELKDYKGSIDDYDKAIKIKPNYEKAYYNRGNLKLKLQNYRGAIYDCNKAIKIKPNYAKAYYNRGNAKYELKDYQGAINDYQTALKHSKDKVLNTITNKELKQAKKKLKESQGKLPKYKK